MLRFAAPENLIASGYVWDEKRRQLAYKPYLDGRDLLIANAVMIAPSRVR